MNHLILNYSLTARTATSRLGTSQIETKSLTGNLMIRVRLGNNISNFLFKEVVLSLFHFFIYISCA